MTNTPDSLHGIARAHPPKPPPMPPRYTVAPGPRRRYAVRDTRGRPRFVYHTDSFDAAQEMAQRMNAIGRSYDEQAARYARGDRK